MKDEWKKLIAIRDGAPYIGVAVYGVRGLPLRIGDIERIAGPIDQLLTPYEFNRAQFMPQLGDRRRRERDIIRRSLQGRRYRKFFEDFKKTTFSWMVLSNTPSIDLGCVMFSYLSMATNLVSDQPFCSLECGRLCNKSTDMELFDYLSVLRQLMGFSREEGFCDHVFLNAFSSCCEWSLRPQVQKDTFGYKQGNAPLISNVSISRSDGAIGDLQPYTWTGQPFNLYWGNGLKKSLVVDSGLDGFLANELGFEMANSTDELSPNGSIVSLANDLVFIALSDDISDSICPSEAYSRRYNKILEFLLSRGLIYPGLQ